MGLPPDLFYRLNVFPLEVPPLRDRKDDLQCWSSIRANATRSGRVKQSARIDRRLWSVAVLRRPGNIRELQNILERSVIPARFA